MTFEEKRAYNKKWREAHPSHQREYRAAHLEHSRARDRGYYQAKREVFCLQQRGRAKAKQSVLIGIKLKSGCVDCGYDKHPQALQFDHVRGEKSFSISNSLTRSLDVLLAEVAKCEVRCANCHAIKTAERRGPL